MFWYAELSALATLLSVGPKIDTILRFPMFLPWIADAQREGIESSNGLSFSLRREIGSGKHFFGEAFCRALRQRRALPIPFRAP